jgi:hypothetical protein
MAETTTFVGLRLAIMSWSNPIVRFDGRGPGDRCTARLDP